jgi:hypothetical protein
MRYIFFLLLAASFSMQAQTKVGDKWVDDNLEFRVDYDDIKKTGIFSVCIFSTERNECIQNLSTGFEIELLSGSGKVLWKGTSMGRKKQLKLPKAFAGAVTLKITAFKPYVINKNTGTRIHQTEKLQVKHMVK